MEPEAADGIVPNRQIALLIDADNISHNKVAAMLAELSKYGTAHIRRAYGDWSAETLKGWRARLLDFAIRPIQQFSYSTGKNATDIALVIDAMEMLHTRKPDAFCIASSDADFTPLVMQIKSHGLEVYGFGERKAPSPFVNACTTFLYLDSVGDEPTTAPVHKTPVEPQQKSDHSAAKATPAAKQAIAAPARKSLAQDTKLVTILRGAVEASMREDGWAMMAAAGSAAKRQAPIDPRNYGARNFPALFEATGLFEICKSGKGQAFVADKRNKDRSPAPSACT